MEGLVLLLGEFCFGFALEIVPGVCQLLAIVIEVIIQIIITLIDHFSGNAVRKENSAISIGQTLKNIFNKKLIRILLIMSLISFLGLILFFSVFFEQNLRWMINRAAQKTQIEFNFDSYEGTPLKGYI